MKIEVQQLMYRPTPKYPYNYRVEFCCEVGTAEQIVAWAKQHVQGLCWRTTPGAVLYTTEEMITLCKLKWV